MDTVTTLEPDIVDKLQDLIALNLDGAAGCREAAEAIDDPAIADTLCAIAEERRVQAGALQTLVGLNDEEPRTAGSALGAAHRYWLDLRATLSGGDPQVVLTEAERGESKLEEAYQEAMRLTVGSPAYDLICEYYLQAKSAHDTIRDLRTATGAPT